MANPIFNKFGNNQNGSSFIPGGGRQNPMMGMMQKFQQFNNIFSGDPDAARAQVQQLLDSGQMSREQFELFSQIANMSREQFSHMVNMLMGRR